MKRHYCATLIIFMFTSAAYAQVGIFDMQADWDRNDGTKAAGSATFENGVYTVSGNGDDIWATVDEGFFLYTERAGSWTLTAKAAWWDPGDDEWSKQGIMIREVGDAATSGNYMIRQRGNSGSPDQLSAQWRNRDGAESFGTSQWLDQSGNSIADPGLEGVWMRLSRNAITNQITASWSRDGNTWTVGHQMQLPLGETAAYGFAVTNHQANEFLAVAQYSNVTLEEGAPISVARVLPRDRVTSGEPIAALIHIGNPSQVGQTIAITERVPAGWTVSNISHGGTISDNVISWSLEAASGLTELSYQAVSTPAAEVQWSGEFNGASILGDREVVFLRARTPVAASWNPPEGGWLYLFDPDLGSSPNMEEEGWKHNNGSDEFVFQPVIPSGPNAGEVWRNPGLIDDGEGGLALLIYDAGDTRNRAEYGNIPDPGNRKITLNYDLGPVTKAVASFRVRSTEFVDQFGVTIPFGYSENEGYNLLGLMINREMRDLNDIDALSASGLFFSPEFPDSLEFPTYSAYPGHAVTGSFEEPWDHTQWHEYWITWNVTEGEKSTSLYVNGELEAKFSYPMNPNDDIEQRGGFFNRVREADGDVPIGNAVFRITFRQTGGTGNLQFDYIAFAPDTDEPPTAFTPVDSWFIY